MSILKKIISVKSFHLSVYMLASLGPMVVSVLLNPLFAINMSPKDYAICGYYNSFNPIFLPLINFLFVRYYLKRYFEVDESERKRIKATVYQLSLIVSFGLLIVALVSELIYMKYFNSNSELPFLPYSILALVPCYFQSIYILELNELRMSSKSVGYLKINWLSAFSALLLSLLFVVIFKWGAMGKLLGVAVASAFIFLYLLLKNKDLLKIKLDRSLVKCIVLFCLPIVIADMLEFFSKGFDKVFLERIVDPDQLGYYTVGFSIAGLLSVFSKAISDTFAPDIYEAVAKRDLSKGMKYGGFQVALIAVIVLLFILFLPFIIDILTAGRYVKSTKFAMIISLSSITSGIYFLINNVMIALGKTKTVLSTKLIGSGFCVLMYYFLIKEWGTIGASWGIVLSYLILSISNFACYFIGERIILGKNYEVNYKRR